MLIRNEEPHSPTLNLRTGEVVEIRSKEEILATLDELGQLNALPFMPEMLKFCGRQFRVFKSAHKTCDTIEKTGGRRMKGAVHLEGLRCDGEDHGGCQAGCLLFWNEAWLKRVGQPDTQPESLKTTQTVGRCSEESLMRAVYRIEPQETADGEPTYRCQTTELLKFTSPLRWWDLRQYIADVTSRNVKLSEICRAAAFHLFMLVLKIGAYNFLTSLYDRFQRIRGGVPFPYRQGRLKSTTPALPLALRDGEAVRVKSHAEILETLNTQNKNRGLFFDAEMVRYCGGSYHVLRKVERIIEEKTGKMKKLPNDCIILDGVTCRAHFSNLRLFCPRAIYPFWRQAWLKREE